jgi:hypothetical protein
MLSFAGATGRGPGHAKPGFACNGDSIRQFARHRGTEGDGLWLVHSWACNMNFGIATGTI